MKIQIVALLLLTTATAFAVPGTPAAIQQAVNQASPGGTVIIDNGTYNWGTGSVTVDRPVVIRGASRGGVQINAINIAASMFGVTEPQSGIIKIANINVNFERAANAWSAFVVRVAPRTPRTAGRILLHDCDFITNYAYSVEWNTNGGVIWNCLFQFGNGRLANGLTGVSFVCHTLNSDWTRVSTLGTLDTDGMSNTYVEDCTFRGAGVGCMNPDDNSRVVIRHNLFDNAASGSHGQETRP
jgi:hypothetical protein